MPSRSPPRPNPTLASRRGSTRTTGLVIAALLGTASIATVSYFATRGGKGRPTGPTFLPNDGAVPPPELIQPGKISSRPGSPTSTGGKGIKAEIASRSDPTKVAGRILSASLDPLEGNRYRAELPQSYLYLKDGRTIYIRSDTAKFLLPQGPSGQPDSGVLEGHVVINVFDRRADGTEIQLGRDTPALNITTSTLTFDMTAGEFTGPERFVVTGPAVDFAGTGLNILYNQKDERLELLTIAKSETLKLRPKNQRPTGTSATTSTGPSVAATPPTAPNPTTSPASPDTAARARSGSNPETFYHATFSGAVSVRQSERAIDSDLLELWIRLVDNQLAPDAIAQAKPAKKTGPSLAGTPAPTGAATPAAGPDATPIPAGGSPAPLPGTTPIVPGLLAQTDPPTPAAPPDPTPAAPDGEVVLNWSGPLELRPLNERPAPLASNEVAARFSAKPGSLVAFKDSISNADGSASTLDYSATTRDIAMSAPELRGVRLTLPNAGEVRAQKLTVNLNTGVASVASGGELRGLGKGTGLAFVGGTEFVGPLQPTTDALAASDQLRAAVSENAQGLTTSQPSTRSVAWTDQADFLFATANGTMTGSLLSATLAGSVHGTDGRASLDANWLQAEFSQHPQARDSSVLAASAPAKNSGPATTLSRLRAEDHAVATDGRGGSASADRLDVAFEPRADAPKVSDPALVTLTGRAVASQRGSTLGADLIEARLARPTEQPDASEDQRGEKPDDKSGVRDVLARGNVRFSRDDGVWAQGDELRATTATQIADLLGAHAAIGKDQSSVEGTQMRLDGLARALEVFGPGGFRFTNGTNKPDHDAPGPGAADTFARPPTQPANGWASWSLGMTFDDRSGFLDCRGNVTAEMNPDAMTQRRLRGDRLHLELTPGSASANGSTSAAPIPGTDNSEPRKLLRAAIFGSEDSLSESARASVQSATFEPGEDPSGPRRMIGLQYLEGPTIRADDVLGTLTVPAAGRMLVADHRPADPSPSGLETSSAPETTIPSSTPGESGTRISPSSRGDTLFTWQGGLVADRNASTATINGTVRITQQGLGKDGATELESEEVVAHVSDPNASAAKVPTSGSADPELRVRLTRAIARGAVWARSDGKELTADLLDYDAVARRFLASGSDNNDAILFDPAKPTPITAKLLEWDLARGRVEVKKPGTIVVPADIVKAR